MPLLQDQTIAAYLEDTQDPRNANFQALLDNLKKQPQGQQIDPALVAAEAIWIRCADIDALTCSNLDTFWCVYATFTEIKQWQHLFLEESKFQQAYAALLSTVTTYINTICSDANAITAPALPVDFDAQKEAFLYEKRLYKASHHMDFIENFFVDWHEEKGREDQNNLKPLYQELLAISESIVLSDEAIENLMPSSVEEDPATIRLMLYKINRVFLQAFLIRPDQWTPCFTEHLKHIIDLVYNAAKYPDAFDRTALQLSYNEIKKDLESLVAIRQIQESSEPLIVKVQQWVQISPAENCMLKQTRDQFFSEKTKETLLGHSIPLAAWLMPSLPNINVFWKLCATSEGQSILEQGLVAFWDNTSSALWALAPDSGPYQGITPLWWLCSTGDGVSFLERQLKTNPNVLWANMLSKAWALAPTSGQNQGKTPFWWLCTTQAGRSLLEELSKSEAFWATLPPEVWTITATSISGLHPGRTPLQWLRASSQGQAILTESHLMLVQYHPTIFEANISSEARPSEHDHEETPLRAISDSEAQSLLAQQSESSSDSGDAFSAQSVKRFLAIYYALFEAQHAVIKKDSWKGLAGRLDRGEVTLDQACERIKRHGDQHPHSRTAYALILLANYKTTDDRLRAQIVAYGHQHSNFFTRTTVNGQSFWGNRALQETLAVRPDNTALSGPRIEAINRTMGSL